MSRTNRKANTKGKKAWRERRKIYRATLDKRRNKKKPA